MIVPQRNPTLPWADIQCKVKWDRRAPKPQYRWSFPQINLHTVTSLNQHLHIFSKVFFFWLFEQCPVQPLWVLGMRCLHLPVKQGVIAARVGFTRATVNRILKRHAATGSLVPGKSSGAPRKTTPFARHYFGDNYRYQDDNATPHRARVVLDFLQQGNVTKMEQPPRSPDCNPIEHLWDELGRAISSMDNPPQNLDELRQALLDKWAHIPVQRLQRLVASMHRRLAAIIAARGGNTRYWPGTHKTRPPSSVTKKIIFVRPNLPQLSSSDI